MIKTDPHLKAKAGDSRFWSIQIRRHSQYEARVFDKSKEVTDGNRLWKVSSENQLMSFQLLNGNTTLRRQWQRLEDGIQVSEAD